MKIIGSFNDVNLIFLPSRKVEIINALIRNQSIKEKFNKKLLIDLINFLVKKRNIDIAVSCSCLYKREKIWAETFTQLNLPFVAWHKEFTLIRKEDTKKIIKNIKRKFERFKGALVCCNNNTAKKILSESKIMDKKKIKITGLIRADHLFKKEINLFRSTKKSIVFFSFGHTTGPFFPTKKTLYENRDHYFSKNNNEGFINLFKSTHLIFMKKALLHPNIDFFIKPKNPNPGWIKEIKLVAQKKLNCNFNEIKNCHIVHDNAYNLMKNSSANICFNSTTLIESVLSEKNTIIPLYFEAKNQHSDQVYFKKYLDLFSVANSESDFENLIEKSLSEKKLKQINNSLLKKLCKENLGNNDGQSGKRFVETLRSLT